MFRTLSTILLSILFGCLIADDLQQKDSKCWIPLSKVEMAIDTSLHHYGKNFLCDSVVGINYIGFKGEESFYPINEKGIVANTIKKTKKLNANQVLRLHQMLSNKLFYEKPRLVACYEPRLAFVYFRKGKVIAQTQICISCAGLWSTAKLLPNKRGSLFNQKATDELRKLAIEPGLTDKVKTYR